MVCIPDGWKLVPIEPVETQHKAALEFGLAHMKRYGVDGLSPFKDYPPLRETIDGMYRAMLDAAPPVQSEKSLSGWQPIETAPKDGSSVLIFNPQPPAGYDNLHRVIGRWSDYFLRWIAAGHILYPTHWQPLSTAPLPTDPPQSEGE